MMGGGYPSWALPLRPATELPHPLARACPEQPSDPLCFCILAHSFARFCTLQKLNSFLFKRFRTLCTKHPGWGDHFSRAEDFPRGNSMGSAGGLSAISSSCGYCWRSGSGTFTFELFRMLISCSALTTAFPGNDCW